MIKTKKISISSENWANPYHQLQYQIRKSLENKLSASNNNNTRPFFHLVPRRNKYLARKEDSGEVYILSILLRPPYERKNSAVKHNLIVGAREIVIFIHTNLNTDNNEEKNIFDFRIVEGETVWQNENMLITASRLNEKKEILKAHFLNKEFDQLCSTIARITEDTIENFKKIQISH